MNPDSPGSSWGRGICRRCGSRLAQVAGGCIFSPSNLSVFSTKCFCPIVVALYQCIKAKRMLTFLIFRSWLSGQAHNLYYNRILTRISTKPLRNSYRQSRLFLPLAINSIAPTNCPLTPIYCNLKCNFLLHSHFHYIPHHVWSISKPFAVVLPP